MSSKKRSKAITDFYNYEVTQDGRVFNDKKHELKQTINRNGYPMVKLCKNGYEKNCSVHRLVAEAFIENPENKRVVNHIDGNKQNNDVSNLEWCTYSENEKHAYKHGLRSSHLTYEDRKLGARISGDMRSKRVKIVETGEIYPSAIECSRKTGCDVGAISKCCNGLANKHHGYHFEYISEEDSYDL